MRPVSGEGRTRVVEGQAFYDDSVSVDDPWLRVTYVHNDNGQFVHSQTEAHIRRSATCKIGSSTLYMTRTFQQKVPIPYIIVLCAIFN